MEEKISGRKPSYGFFSRVMYGIGEFFGGGCFLIINSFYAVFLTKALGMPTALAGTIPLVGKLWDAITDPIITAMRSADSRVHFVKTNIAPTSSSAIDIVTENGAVTQAGSMR